MGSYSIWSTLFIKILINIINYNKTLQRPFKLIFTKFELECNEEWAHIVGDIIKNQAGSTYIVGNFTIKKDIIDAVMVINNFPLMYSIHMSFTSKWFLFQGKYRVGTCPQASG